MATAMLRSVQKRIRRRVRLFRHGVWTPCKLHEFWDDDPACVRCGYVFKRDMLGTEAKGA